MINYLFPAAKYWVQAYNSYCDSCIQWHRDNKIDVKPNVENNAQRPAAKLTVVQRNKMVD